MAIILNRPPRPKWLPYYWNCAKHFGQECYRTWRQELFASLMIAVIAFVIRRGADPTALGNLQLAFLSSGIGLGLFALYHLIRAPFLAHAQAIVGDPNAAVPTIYGLLGLVVLCAIGLGATMLAKEIYEAQPRSLVSMTVKPPLAPIVRQEPPLATEHWKDVVFSVEKSKPPAPDHLILFVYSLYSTIRPPLRFNVTCTELAGISDVHMTVGDQDVVNPKWKLMNNEKVVELQFDGPALNTLNMLTVEIFGTGPQFKIVKVENWGK